MAVKVERSQYPEAMKPVPEPPRKLPEKPQRGLAGIIWFLVAGHYFTWLKFLPDSFWLDECGTAWIVQGGFGDLHRRTLLLLHAPLFGAIATAAASIGGINEIALRLPSWIAIGISIYLFSRLAWEVLEPDTAKIALAIFTVWPLVCYSAADARPYSFALAALCGCYLFFLRAIRSGRKRDFAGFCLCGATLVHLHLLFVYVLGIPVVFLLLFDLPAARRHRTKWLGSALVLLILLAPLALHYRVMFMLGSRYSFSPLPPWSSLFAMFAPSRPLFFFMIMTILCAGFKLHIRFALSPRDRFGLAFSLLAGLFPILLLFAVSRLTESGLFVPRYMIPAVPGLALFWGWVIGRLEPIAVRYYIGIGALVMILATQWMIGDWRHESDDWRGALNRAAVLNKQDDHALVLYTSYVESASLEALSKPDHVAFLLAPLAAYPATTAHVVALPLGTNEASQAFWDAEFHRAVKARRSFTVVLRAYFYQEWWRDHLIRYAAGHGFRLANKENFGKEPHMPLLRFVR